MITSFEKYRQAFLVGLQSNIVYRWNFVVRGFFSLFHLAVVFILWGPPLPVLKKLAASTSGKR